MTGALRAIARAAFVLLLLATVGLGLFIAVTLSYFERNLPSVKTIADYVPAVGSKIYAADGKLITEFESQHRIPVKIDQVPPLVREAFLAAEDRDFYKHGGVNPAAMLRAAATDLFTLGRGRRPIGASTITQQVVRHFLLSNEVSITRKIKEALLAYRIERTLSKKRILGIYLNEIYLGEGAYGVAAAADTYFQKPLDKLTLAEAATLAALPKAPSNYDPLRHPRAARARRDWVLTGMEEVGWISKTQAQRAIAEPLGVDPHAAPANPRSAELAGYFTEEVRRELIARFGEKAVYESGLSVRTSYNSAYQQMAETSFRDGLVAYDRRHGWRGPIAHYPSAAAATNALSGMSEPAGPERWQLAVVTATGRERATIALKNGKAGVIPLGALRWARRTETDQRLGPAVRRVSDVLHPGDIVLVESSPDAAGRRRPHPEAATYALRQIPNVSGGVVVEDPKTGRIFALVGGWSFRQSQFDRATQAMRQPGSSFKPFVYVTALENGFAPGTEVDDAPVSIPQGPGLPPWEPANYESGYVGWTTLEDALVHSRNLATVNVALSIGLPKIATTVQDFGVMDKMPLYYSMVLGAGTTTLTRMTTAYAMIDNGGHWLLSSLIDEVRDRNGRILYQKGVADCAACFVASAPHGGSGADGLYQAAGPAKPSMSTRPNAVYAEGATLYKPQKPDPLVTPDADWQLVQMMEGVVQHGTGISVAAVGKPLAGKTGTTSDWKDAWFVGFSPGLVAGVYVGFDEPRTLGHNEQGGHVAAPIFRDFMMAALDNVPVEDFTPPPGAEPAVASEDSGAQASDPGDASADSYDSDRQQGDFTSEADAGATPEPGWRPRFREVAPGYYEYEESPPPDIAEQPRWRAWNDRGYAEPGEGPFGYGPPYPGSSGPQYARRDYPPGDDGPPGEPGPSGAGGSGFGYPAPPQRLVPQWGSRPSAGTGGLY